MPTYFPKKIEPKWQAYWLEHKTFRARDDASGPKYYILDMFPYPSGDGLHVGHPEGYTATDILARYKRMRGFNVLHPMGWDAFGLPAEQYAVETGTHPRVTTAQNVATFRRQIQSLGFSYDWDREINTTDPGYYRWTQWIFLKLYDTWYDTEQGRGRPIAELPIPPEVQAQGADVVRAYRDARRLAQVAEVPVNWCEGLGTVLANEEVINGRSERGGHPVVRLPLKQWMLRITSYAERLLADLEPLDWPEPIKEMQRNWIGRSEGAEVDFLICPADHDASSVERWFNDREQHGWPQEPDALTIRVYTTRPDTLFGATYMVLAPEHPLVDRVTTPEQKSAVSTYREQAARKSDMDRTDLAKEKTGVFTGAYAINPVNGHAIPVWIADYVMMGYGTGAIMAVPAHDERDFEFAKKFDLEIVDVVVDPGEEPSVLLQMHRWLGDWERRADREDDSQYLKVVIPVGCGFDIDSFQADIETNQADPLWSEVRCFVEPDEETGGVAISYLHDDFPDILLEYVEQTEESQLLVFTLDPVSDDSIDELTAEEEAEAEQDGGVEDSDHDEDEADSAFTGEGISIDSGIITGLPTAEAKTAITAWLEARGLGKGAVNYKLRDWLFSRQRYWGEPFPILLDDQDRHQPLAESELPVQLPELSDYKPTGTPEPPLSKAGDWLIVERDGQRLRRETNTMPQWAGSCWYYLRFIDPDNDQAAVALDKERYWMPVDLYVGGAEHAVLHLLYARFWHKVLYDLGVVHTPEPFQKLVNQGMILGELEFLGYRAGERWVNVDDLVDANSDSGKACGVTGEPAEPVKLTGEQVHKVGDRWVLAEDERIHVDARAFKMSKSRRNVINPDEVVDGYGADSLRIYEMFMGPLEATKPWSMSGVDGVWRFLNRVWRLMIDEDAEELRLAEAVAEVEPTRQQLRMLHLAIRGVTEDLEAMRFNTAISKLMELTNFLNREKARPRQVLETMLLLLSPFAPHLAEELWAVFGHQQTLAYEPWPVYDESLCQADQVEVAVQINNKVRSKLTVAPDLPDDELIRLAIADAKIQELTGGKQIIKQLVVASRKGKLVNLVVKG